MRIEHMALNIRKPGELAKWLADHLGMRIVRAIEEPPHTQFVADAEGCSMLELYENPKATIPDYAAMDPLTLHLAFQVDDVEAVRERLLAAGAAPEGQATTTPDGDELAMVRGPSGLAIQLMKRKDPMI